ncbi:unnamed protein product, partial [Closterium sp. NIES-54]
MGLPPILLKRKVPTHALQLPLPRPPLLLPLVLLAPIGGLSAFSPSLPSLLRRSFIRPRITPLYRTSPHNSPWILLRPFLLKPSPLQHLCF